MNSVIISKSFPHAFDQQHFPRKGSRSCTGVPWRSALCCLQGKNKTKQTTETPQFPCCTFAQTAANVISLLGVECGGKKWVLWVWYIIVWALGKAQHGLRWSGSWMAPLPLSCQSWQAILFKACNINIILSYVVYSLPAVSAEDKEKDIW